MQAVTARVPLRAPTFIRLLAGLADADLPATGPSPADQLGQWIDWTRAVALSRALDGRMAPGPAPDGDPEGDPEGDAADCARSRATLQAAISAGDGAGDATDFAPFRQHVVERQRAMQAATGRLRGRLRDRLATTSPVLARLAEVDAAMELALSPREHSLLSAVPVLLSARFERLRRSAGEAADDPLPPVASHWRDRFRADMRHVLLAELDLRFHPIDGLLAALHPR